MFNLLESPKIEDSGISFYEGDTFSISFVLDLTYTDGTEYTIEETDIIKFKVVKKSSNETIYDEELTGITGNTVIWSVDEALTSLFTSGYYRFGMQLVSSKIKTLIPPTEIYVREVI